MNGGTSGGSLLATVGPYLAITILFSLPAVPFLSAPVLASSAALALATGLGAAHVLELGRKRGTEYVLAGFAAGTAMKAASLGLTGALAWAAQDDLAAALLLNLGLLLLHSGWTSWRLAVSSGAGFTK